MSSPRIWRTNGRNNAKRQKRHRRLLSQKFRPQRPTATLHKRPPLKRPRQPNRRTLRPSSRQGRGRRRRKRNSQPTLAKRKRRSRAANRTAKPHFAGVKTRPQNSENPSRRKSPKRRRQGRTTK